MEPTDREKNYYTCPDCNGQGGKDVIEQDRVKRKICRRCKGLGTIIKGTQN